MQIQHITTGFIENCKCIDGVNRCIEANPRFGASLRNMKHDLGTKFHNRKKAFEIVEDKLLCLPLPRWPQARF